MSRHLADYYSRSVSITRALDCFVFDRSGKKYLDCIAGWCVGTVGWGNAEVRDAIVQEAAEGRYVPPLFRFEKQEEFATLLCRLAPHKKLIRAFRCTSGSEAVEFAIKCARATTRKSNIVSIDGVYHGHTYGAAAVGEACGRNSAMAPCPPGFLKLPLPHPLHGPSEDAVIEEFAKLVQSTADIAAFMSEPVWTNAGAIVPSSSFYPRIERICRKNNILFIMDEVATGFGHCGTLFASELWGLQPDILCLGKGISGGYGTIAATLVTESVFRKSRSIPSYSTFGWVPLDMAAARANIEIIVREKLWKNASDVGAYFLEQLRAAFLSHPCVGDIRGIGLVLGIEIVKNKKKNTPDKIRAFLIQRACEKRGLLLETIDGVLFLTPPLIFSRAHADEAVSILKKVLR
ncbi:aspartate aminotransferase family protein [Candidatus Uhrbacteria bacterium]|nr:aspartate aminotransferase family protein [Candidatus Uhrbacteria bacterium]